MPTLPQLAQAILDRDALLVRGLVLALQHHTFAHEPDPKGYFPDVQTMSAAVVDLWTLRRGIVPPEWIDDYPPFPEPFFVMKRALIYDSVRLSCLAESPYPLKMRNIFAPANFLTFA